MITFALHPLTFDQVQAALAKLEQGYGNQPVLLANSAPDGTAVATWTAPLRTVTPEQQANLYGNAEQLRLSTTIPATVAPGAYLLEMRTGYVNDQLLVLISNQSLVVKQSGAALLAWASRFDGTALADQPLRLLGGDGQILAEGRTDETGLFRTPLPAAEPWYVLAYQADDTAAPQVTAVVGNSWSWRTEDSSGMQWATVAPAAVYRTALYTDRPIYRPGQTVHFKAIVRRDDDAVLSLPPSGTPVTVRMLDREHNTVRTFDLDTNEMGTVHGDFTLAAGAMLGTYAVAAEVGGETVSQIFQVEAYHKPDYTVDVAIDAPDLRVGAPATVTVTSRYLNGNPVVDGVAMLSHYLLSNDSLNGPAPFFSQLMGDYDNPRLALDAQGQARFTFIIGQSGPSPLGLSGTGRWAIEATVRDGANQVVSNYALVEQRTRPAHIAMHLPAATMLPGQLFDLALTATDPLGLPVPYANMQLTVNASDPNAAQPNGEPLRKPGVYAVDLTMDRAGTLQLPLRFAEPGYYQLQLARYDAKGQNINPVHSALLVYDESAPWVAVPDGFLTISAPDRAFVPGESVPLEIFSSFGARALLTVERGSVRRTQTIELTPPRTLLDLPITPEDAPNLFVTINAWTPARDSGNTMQSQRDYRLRMATTEIAVTPVNKQLTVTITADRTTYGPRDQATFAVRVVDERGVPVQAELSFALVDEAIFTLSDALLPSLYETFYAARDHQVATFDGTAPLRSFGFWGGGGGGGGFFPANPRWYFPDTALWLPALATDADGEAVITAALPDTLTTWRAVVKAVTVATQVGEASATVATDLPVSIQPLIPSTLTVGDEALLSVLLHNNSTAPQTLTVTVALSSTVADAFTFATAVTRTLTIEPAHSAMAGWPATVVGAGKVALLVTATSAGGSDAIRVPLTVHPAAIRTVAVDIGDFRGSFTKTITVAETLPDLAQVRVELSRSTAGTMLEGLNYLTGYPYGCVEQTMSLALPNAVVGRAFRQLGIGDPELRHQLPELINAGVQRLYAFQHPDGGWGWWENDNSDAYQTAWVLFGLAQTADAGYEISEQVVERAGAYLAQHMLDYDAPTQAFAFYALSQLRSSSYVELMAALADRADRLDAFSQAALALVLQRAGEVVRAHQLLDLLAASVVAEPGMVHWPISDPDGVYEQKTMASATRTTALALSAFTALRPDDELIPGMVRWLLAQRQGYGWGTTNETSFTLLALTDHLLATAREETEATFTLRLNDNLILTGTMDSLQPSTVVTLTGAALDGGENRLEIVTDEATRLYYRLLQSSYDGSALWQPAGTVPVYREYLDPATRDPLTDVAVGQLVAVQLTVQLDQPRMYVLVEDRVPSGLRALNEALANERNALPGYDDALVNWGGLGYNHKEIRADRVTFFVTTMAAGSWQVTYLARATTAGTFTALPAEAYAMYDLAQWGRTGGSRLMITDK
ncbi:MAG: MG2 domain-containing protein [Caldilineaceae bacterium]